MTEYQLQILRNAAVMPNYDTAMAVLNSYQYHHVGQPLAVRYYDSDQKVAVLFAIGKKDCEDIVPGEPNCGPDFYDIINRNSGAVTAVMKWRILGGSIDQDVTHALYTGPHSDLTGTDAADFDLGTLVYCTNGIIARVKKLKESETETIDDWYDFYGNVGGETTDIHWDPITEGVTQEISFKEGSQTEYDGISHDAGALYVTKEEDRADRLYKGDNLLGDAYVSSEQGSAVVSTDVGGIKSGTTLDSIMNSTQGSVSKVLDMILFPAYAPRYSGPSCVINTPAPANIFIFDALPSISYNTTQAYTYASSSKVFGGSATVQTTRTYPNGTTDDATTSAVAEYIGKYTYSAVASFAPGTDLIKDTKGNPAHGWADNNTTLTSSTLHTEYLSTSGDGYVVGARSISAANKALNAVYPIWVGAKGQAEPTQLSIGQSYTAQNGGTEYTLSEASGMSSGNPDPGNSWYIDVPTGKSLTVILRALDGTYPTTNTQQIKKISTNVSSRQWTSSALNSVHIMIDRYVYNGPSYSGGLHKIIVS
jgi:hypothetical protein